MRFNHSNKKKKRKAESKNTNVRYKDLVKGNYNPEVDNIIATDVSYIPANLEERNVYLSAAINHKTKYIESWKISATNDNQLVIDTIASLNRSEFIFHSDHGIQYSSRSVLETLKKLRQKLQWQELVTHLIIEKSNTFLDA